MKKYTFTLIVEEVAFSNTVNNIIEKVKEEKRIESLIEQNNNNVIKEMKNVLEVVYSDLTELLKPLDLTVSSHFRKRSVIRCLDSNCFGKLIDLKIGGSKEHCGVSEDAVIIRLYCPYESGKLTFNPKLVMFAENYCSKTKEFPFISSDNLIDTFNKTIEKMYKNNLK
jgi:hypothetical protein